MTHALSIDLRRRVTAAISQGKSRRAAAAQFLISAATAVNAGEILQRLAGAKVQQLWKQ